MALSSHRNPERPQAYDRFGLWVDFEIVKEVQRMRWVEAGSFITGSPVDEPECWKAEGPHDLVYILVLNPQERAQVAEQVDPFANWQE